MSPHNRPGQAALSPTSDIGSLLRDETASPSNLKGPWKKRVSTACLACKKSKRKCSGTPPCDNCRSLQRICIFDESLDQRRRVAAKRTASELTYHRDLLNDIFRVIRETNESRTNELLGIIRQNASAEEIRTYIDDALSSPGKDPSSSRETVAKLEDARSLMRIESDSPAFRSKVMDIHYLCDEALFKVPAHPWTAVTDDADLVSHLISLYFTWDYPFLRFLDRDVFLRHMQSGELSSEFCTPYLVNAMLSNACFFSEFSESYVVPGELSSKGNDFLAEAERLRAIQSPRPSLALLQATLLMHERYAMSCNDDRGYIMLHEAIRIGEALGLVGSYGPKIVPEHFSEEMDMSCRIAGWGLFNIDTIVHTGFLRPCLIDHVNVPRLNGSSTDDHCLWRPYPTHREPCSSHESLFFEETCNLSTIARDISRIFGVKEDYIDPLQRQTRDVLFERLGRWHHLLPGVFMADFQPPHMLLLEYVPCRITVPLLDLIILTSLVYLNKNGRKLPGRHPKRQKVPPRNSPESKYNPWEVTLSAARSIAALVQVLRREHGVSRAHHFAMYSINLALFTLLEHPSFDILDPDFLSLVSSFSVMASRSPLGRNLFHLFRQSVRAKGQGERIRNSDRIPEALKDLFDEDASNKLQNRFDGYAEGLEKLNQDSKYHGIGRDGCTNLQDYPGLNLGESKLNGDRGIPKIPGNPHTNVAQLALSSFYTDIPRLTLPLMSRHRERRSSTPESVPGRSAAPAPLWPAFQTPGVPMLQRGFPYPGSYSGSLALTSDSRVVSSTAFSPSYQPPPAAFPSGAVPSSSPPPNKIAIPRIAAPSRPLQRRRATRACEPCRKRKVKCDSKQPSCGPCTYASRRCVYEDVKRIRNEKKIDQLTKRVERYENLLRDLEGDVDSPTAHRIRRAIRFKDEDPSPVKEDKDADTASSVGSLEALDENSEVSWMQGLSGGLSPASLPDAPPDAQSRLTGHLPIAVMNYHLDDLALPLQRKDVDQLAMPRKEIASEYFNAYVAKVHPFFEIVREQTFTAQYEQCINHDIEPPRKWLAILNMIFAIGCRHCRLTNPTHTDAYDDDLVFLSRACHLGLRDNVLFEHPEIQQVQLEFLIALYLLCLGQLNRASKFSNMALHSAMSLGINLRLKDDTTDSSKEARCRLWWSIYSLEHLITSMNGRASCIGEQMCAVSLPVPVEEEAFGHLGVQSVFQDQGLREVLLSATLFEKSFEIQSTEKPWAATNFQPNPSLFFFYMTDLSLLTQAVLNKVYSLEGVRNGASQTEYRFEDFTLRMDRWIHKLPDSYQFVLPGGGPWRINPDLDNESLPYARERVCLALNYYSARITLCRPCLSLHSLPSDYSDSPTHSLRTTLRAEMTNHCLQAACSLISILPEKIDITWLARIAPWWSVLHFLMQATVALLLSLSSCSMPTELGLGCTRRHSPCSSAARPQSGLSDPSGAGSADCYRADPEGACLDPCHGICRSRREARFLAVR
ncbi:C6 transcription factor [Penicillium chermesinum]|nr:C6 transcription factor [Penicillium chermesinum]